MYECGYEVKKDIYQAIHLHNKSAKQGYKYAQKKLKVLSKYELL